MRLLEKRPIPFGGLWSLWLLSAVTQCGDSRHAFARQAPRQSSTSEHDLASAGHSTRGVIGHSLPGNWRPFSDDSPWNTPIAADARVHPDSDVIMALIAAEAKHIRFARLYAIPVWVVDYGKVPLARVRSDRIFDTWDRDRKGWSDVGVPVAPEMSNPLVVKPLKPVSGATGNRVPVFGDVGDPPGLPTVTSRLLRGWRKVDQPGTSTLPTITGEEGLARLTTQSGSIRKNVTT